MNLDKTYLEGKLEESATQISKYCFMFTLLIAILAVLNLFIMTLVKGESLWSNDIILKIIRIWIISICILIVAIPDGMPIAISLAMALSIQGLKKNNILIKNLESIQKCGMLHDVCISKTGTLTTDKMTVSKIHF